MATNQFTGQSAAFAVDPVELGQELLPTEKAHVSIEKLLGTSIESCDTYHVDVVEQPGFHSLFAAVHLAYGPSQKICNIESAKKVCNAAPEKDPSKQAWIARHCCQFRFSQFFQFWFGFGLMTL